MERMRIIGVAWPTDGWRAADDMLELARNENAPTVRSCAGAALIFTVAALDLAIGKAIKAHAAYLRFDLSKKFPLKSWDIGRDGQRLGLGHRLALAFEHLSDRQFTADRTRSEFEVLSRGARLRNELAHPRAFVFDHDAEVEREADEKQVRMRIAVDDEELKDPWAQVSFPMAEKVRRAAGLYFDLLLQPPWADGERPSSPLLMKIR